jgi:hypothetical protein
LLAESRTGRIPCEKRYYRTGERVVIEMKASGSRDVLCGACSRRVNTLSIAVLLLTALALSCSVWNTRQWEGLADKKFYFQKFEYSFKGGDKKTALAFMRDFPLKEVCSLIQKKYGIEIDTAEFDSFLASADESRITEFGIILKERFTWQSAVDRPQAVELEYTNVFREFSTDAERHYTLTIKTNGKKRSVVSDSVEGRDEVPESLAAKLEIR